MSTLKPQLVAAFLASHLETSGEGWNAKTTFNRIPINPDDFRKYRAWRDGENNLTIWALDRLLTKYGVHLDEFFLWCDENPWLGKVPWYERVAA